MTTDQTILFSLIGALFVFLIWGRYRYDLVAFGALLLAYLLGVVPTEEVFAGFGHPAVIIIALVLIISRGLYLSGAIEMIAGALLDGARSVRRHISVMAGVSADTPAMTLMCRRTLRAPSSRAPAIISIAPERYSPRLMISTSAMIMTAG